MIKDHTRWQPESFASSRWMNFMATPAIKTFLQAKFTQQQKPFKLLTCAKTIDVACHQRGMDGEEHPSVFLTGDRRHEDSSARTSSRNLNHSMIKVMKTVNWATNDLYKILCPEKKAPLCMLLEEQQQSPAVMIIAFLIPATWTISSSYKAKIMTTIGTQGMSFYASAG